MNREQVDKVVSRYNEFERRRAFWNKWRWLFKPVMWLFIPGGTHYCYSRSRGVGRCPWWDRNPARARQENGYCHYLGLNDGEEGCFLLWDQCKECGKR